MLDLSIEQLTASYGAIQALKGISLSVGEKEIVSLIGPNGAGKTTLMRVICGLLPPNRGKVIFKTRDMTGVPPHKIAESGIALVPEHREVFGPLTVFENLRLGLYSRRKKEPSSVLASDMEQVFELFPRLKERLKQKAGSLSGGEQQMVAIGRALLCKPQLLLMDEPSLGLAPKVVQLVGETIAKLRSWNLSILLVEQNAELALGLADRAYVLEAGTIALEGSPRELMKDPKVIELYLGI